MALEPGNLGAGFFRENAKAEPAMAGSAARSCQKLLLSFFVACYPSRKYARMR